MVQLISLFRGGNNYFHYSDNEDEDLEIQAKAELILLYEDGMKYSFDEKKKGVVSEQNLVELRLFVTKDEIDVMISQLQELRESVNVMQGFIDAPTVKRRR